MKKSLLLALLVAVGISGCANSNGSDGNATGPIETAASEDSSSSEHPSDGTDTSADGTATDQIADTSADDIATDQVADASEMADVENVTWDGMTAVAADEMNDGDYNVVVDSSSSMFSVENAVLHVKNGEMTATMTMGGTGYLYVYMGTGEEAAAASKDDLIPFEEDEDGAHCFTVPVEALDQGLACAAFSKRKEQWYDRTLVFRADSLPADAFREGRGNTASELGLADGTYTSEVSLSGGSGRASVTSPAEIHVVNGNATAIVEWSSPNYDYMIVDGEKYLPINDEGNSAFEIPVAYFDAPLAVSADTTAMSKPHEIEYTLVFASESVE